MKKAFTLIELLVVVAIISVLASIVITAVEDLRERARVAAVLPFSTGIYRTIGDHMYGEWLFDNENFDDTSPYQRGSISTIPRFVDGIAGGKGVEMDNVNQFLEIDWVQQLQAEPRLITIEAWVDVDEDEDDRLEQAVFSMGGTVLRARSSLVEFIYNSSYTADAASASVNMSGWRHIAATCDYDGHEARLYIDGQLVDIEDLTSSTPPNWDEMRIGRRRNGWQFFGKVDNVRFYTTLLTAEEISTRYAMEKDFYQGPQLANGH